MDFIVACTPFGLKADRHSFRGVGGCLGPLFHHTLVLDCLLRLRLCRLLYCYCPPLAGLEYGDCLPLVGCGARVWLSCVYGAGRGAAPAVWPPTEHT